MHNYIDFFSKKNIEYQFRLLFCTAILIPIIVLGFITYYTVYRNIESDYESLTESKASQVNTALVMTSINFQQICSSLSSDEKLMRILQHESLSVDDRTKELANYKVLFNTLINTPSISDLRLYISSDKLSRDISSGCFYQLKSEDKKTNWYKRAKERSDGFWITEKRTGKGDITYWDLNYYSKIPLPLTGDFVILKATFSDNYLRSLIERDNYEIYICANNDPVFFCTDRYYTGHEFPIDISSVPHAYSKSGLGKIRGHNTIYSTCSIKSYKMSSPIYILVTNNTFYHQFICIMLSLLVLIIIVALISFMIIYLYGRYFIRRVRTLRLAMHKVSNNDYQIIDSIQGKDELTYAFEDLKRMIKDLKEKEAAIYKSRIEEELLTNRQQQMELKLLAGQINPHFLYNTLEMIRMKALTEGNKTVATAIKQLGKCMRYALSNTISTSTDIRKEIEYLNNYLSIMKMRFGERLNYELKIDPKINIEETQILPLLIQPIVENAIIHGLEPTGNRGTLIIKMKPAKRSTLQILVFDNGIGISSETLSSIRQKLFTPPDANARHGIGMYNINTRIRKYYGDEYGININSKPGFATLVTVTIPLNTTITVFNNLD
ncbi:two-component system, sensor histidine kinase YesM [Lachnospiraceae bacterium KH1T2]|nr:two-component system, sensor histidine kinase YesM [Lachnospiraceae bacterium KH1T2]